MNALPRRLLARSIVATAALLLFAPFSHAQPPDGRTGGWSQETSDLPGVRGAYHVATTDPNRRDDRIRSSDDGGIRLGDWTVRTWGNISFGVGASSGKGKAGH
jgi:hypothetical protein